MREMLLLSAGTYFENSMAQILWKSFCCMQAHTLKIQWLRYSGNPSVVCRSILRKFNGAGIREIRPWTGRQYFANSVAQILGTCFCCMQDHTWMDQWPRCSGNPSVVCRNILRKFNGSDTLEIFLLYARACF